MCTMKRLTFFAAIGLFALVVGSAFGVARAQATTGPAKKTFQYAAFLQMRVGQKLFFSFTRGGGQGVTAESIEELMQKVTGQNFAGRGTYPEVLDALGADGWELIQVTDRAGDRDFYFKRSTN